MNLTNFNHITIGAPDLEGLARSLQQMGFTLSEWRPDGLPEILLGTPDDYVILQLYPFAPAGIHAVGVVPSRADLPPLDARTSLELYGYPLFSTRSPGTPPAEVFQHTNGAARLDHLASVAPDLEAKTQNWVEKLGITPLPDVHHPKMLIRPLPVGTRVLELLAPNGPESPIHSRPFGPTSFISVEVFDLDRVLNLLRKVDLTFEGPVEGFLPNTEIITVRGEHNYGLTVQFLHRIPVTPSIP
ncbi:MAG: hypothetical protein N2112_10070, partial [Gemmataceae bacterium]|nr:hypothetical protein [Gemmataceae bacterium]